MTVSKHRGKWRYDFWKEGLRHRKGGYRTKQEARQAEAEARNNLKKMNLDFIKLCESRLKELRTRRTEKYFRENFKLIQDLVKCWGQKSEITRDDVETYLNTRSEFPFAANKELRFIKALFNHAIERRWLTENPARFIKFFPVSKKPKYIPPREDLLKVLETSTGEVRNYLLVVICTMGRIREINQLRWEDIHDDYLILRTRKAKNSDVKERKIPLNPLLRETIENIPRKGQYVFMNPTTETKFDYRKKLLKGLCKRAGVKSFTFHALRHYGATKLASEGVAITDIQTLLGHSRPTTTDIYLQSLSRTVKAASDKLTP